MHLAWLQPSGLRFLWHSFDIIPQYTVIKLWDRSFEMAFGGFFVLGFFSKICPSSRSTKRHGYCWLAAKPFLGKIPVSKWSWFQAHIHWRTYGKCQHFKIRNHGIFLRSKVNCCLKDIPLMSSKLFRFCNQAKYFSCHSAVKCHFQPLIRLLPMIKGAFVLRNIYILKHLGFLWGSYKVQSKNSLGCTTPKPSRKLHLQNYCYHRITTHFKKIG